MKNKEILNQATTPRRFWSNPFHKERRKFKTFESACKGAARLSQLKNLDFRAYKCPICGSFHVGGLTAVSAAVHWVSRHRS